LTYAECAKARVEELKKQGRAVILGVESSCDETAISIVDSGRRELGSALASQIDTHTVYGGVVPEIASRMHVSALDPLLDQALERANLTLDDIDAVAVTYGPGLVGALLTGLSWAKALAYGRNLPLIAVNHIEGHVSANYVAHPDLEPPFVCLVASGGHSHIVLVEKYGEYRLLGRTIDDAAGEAFDKVARVLGLPYPGGPRLDALADEGDDSRYTFPRPVAGGAYDFSFSGIKTAAINQLHRAEQTGEPVHQADFAASFRRAVSGTLAQQAVSAALETGAKRVAAAGGVAANSLLRRELERLGREAGLEVFLPPRSLCTDNAVMIASAGFYSMLAGDAAGLELNARPSIDMFGEQKGF